MVDAVVAQPVSGLTTTGDTVVLRLRLQVSERWVEPLAMWTRQTLTKALVAAAVPVASGVREAL